SSTGQTGAGPSRGRNIALDMAKGEFITTLDADDEYAPRYLDEMHRAAARFGLAVMRVMHKQNDPNTPANANSPPAPYCGLAKFDEYLVSNGGWVTMFSSRLATHR